MAFFKLDITPDEYLTILKSHGWFDLAPFRLDRNTLSLGLTLKDQTEDGEFIISVEEMGVFCEVVHGNDMNVVSIAEKCLSLDIDLSEFYEVISADEKYTWIIDGGFGRYLRSPTLYEDCVKIVATTNTSWKNTKMIIDNLIDNYGDIINSTKIFPDPSILASIPEQELKAKTKCGYRASSFQDIAKNAINEPTFFLGDDWKGFQSKDFFDRLLKIRGMGPGSASYLCRIYGKPYIYSIDSWVAKRCDEMMGLNYRKKDKAGKEKPDLERYEKFAKERYAHFKEYGPSVFWFEISRYWHNDRNWEGDWW